MNQSAVALAADSAATRSGAKIFAANKIFAISKYEPMAVMIYGNAACMRVPWETIVKEYRAHIGPKALPTVEAYGQSFLRFMGENKKLFPIAEQERFAYESTCRHFGLMRKRIVEQVAATVEAGDPVGMRAVRKIVTSVIRDDRDAWKATRPRASLKAGSRKEMRKQYGSQIERAVVDVFENLPLTQAHRGHMLQSALDSWCNGPQNGLSGVVFAGFGRDEMFPQLASYELDGVLLDRPIFWYKAAGGMSHESAAWIVPFAQEDMIRLFIEGVTPRYEAFIESYFHRTLASLDKVVAAALPKDKLTPAVEQRLAAERETLVAALTDDLAEQRKALYVEPLLSIVGSLPMDELASLAESLVNLTSLRRRVSLDDETVGGPIDVAVISRGDGLVWIKRKHYFPPDLNHQFFTNYNRSAK